MDLKEFYEDRDKALATLDLEQYEAFIEKYRPCLGHIPKDKKVIEVSMYKAAVNIPGLPEEVKDKAWEWLMVNGFFPGW